MNALENSFERKKVVYYLYNDLKTYVLVHNWNVYSYMSGDSWM